jgi:hypothetical protein
MEEEKMLNKIVILILGILLCCGGLTWAGNIAFYTDGAIIDGNVFQTVNIWNTATVNMTGGSVLSLGAHNKSMLNISGGSIQGLGGYDSAIVNITSGTIITLIAHNSSLFNLRGGSITGELFAESAATINVFGYDLINTQHGGPWGDGMITGFWQDGSPFRIYTDGGSTYSRINLIPEPASIFLLGFGAFLFRRAH